MSLSCLGYIISFLSVTKWLLTYQSDVGFSIFSMLSSHALASTLTLGFLIRLGAVRFVGGLIFDTASCHLSFS
jgi:hypothetical protein